MADDPGLLKKGPWNGEARDFQDFQDAIRDVLKDEAPNSLWNVQIQVKKSGNPIHQYRIVISPGS